MSICILMALMVLLLPCIKLINKMINNSYSLFSVLLILILLVGCNHKYNTEEVIEDEISGAIVESSDEPSLEVMEESNLSWSSGAFIIKNGNEIQNGPNQKGINPMIATIIFYEDGDFYFDSDTGLSIPGFRGHYQIKDQQIIAESDSSAHGKDVYLVFEILDDDTITFIEDQGGNRHYYINKSKQLQEIVKGDSFVRSGETVEEAEKRIIK